VNWTCS